MAVTPPPKFRWHRHLVLGGGIDVDLDLRVLQHADEREGSEDHGCKLYLKIPEGQAPDCMSDIQRLIHLTLVKYDVLFEKGERGECHIELDLSGEPKHNIRPFDSSGFSFHGVLEVFSAWRDF